MADYPHIPYSIPRLTAMEQTQRAEALYTHLSSRRSCRFFSPDPVPRSVIEQAIRTAGTAPSGANKQPWRFVVVQDTSIKAQIQEAAEAEERKSYEGRMPQSWLDDLAPLGTDWHKPFLTVAPYLIVVFKIDYIYDAEGQVRKHYYVNDSVGIAVGMLLTALHTAGLAALTHTPSPMNFLQKILKRPANEKPFVLIPVGYPADDATVPDIHRKPLPEIMLHV